MTSLEERKKIIHNKINEILDKYEDDEYMRTRTFNYIIDQLPNILNNIAVDHLQRTQRIEDLTADQDIFIQSFLMINQYFYCQSSEKFFLYDGLHFKVINEDDVIMHILKTIRNDKHLMCWRERTRIYIMKKIKETSLLSCVPESETIQYVLDSLYPAIFSTKSEAKYFLCILGDSIIKKNTDLKHFLSPKAKKFIRELNGIAQLLIGANLSTTIKHKYYAHEYENCRILNINDCIVSDNVWSPVVNTVALDLICVACHYSLRYGCSDTYILEDCNDPFLTEKVFYLKNTTPEKLVDLFVDNYLEISKNQPADDQENQLTQQITWKDMQYLWKQFLDSKELPQIMFLEMLKSLLKSKLEKYYKPSLDSFVGITCNQLPIIRKFLSFWEENITVFSENGMQYEIGELTTLLKKWNSNIIDTTNVRNISDKQLIDLIFYFYPNIIIEEQKYIYDIDCKLWNKQKDIIDIMEKYKENLKAEMEKKCSNLSIYYNGEVYSPITTMVRAYKTYCTMAAKMHSSYDKIVSKSFFENFVKDYMKEYILEDNCISAEWILQ